MSVEELAVYLYDRYEMCFSREWDDLPEYVQEIWTLEAEELWKELHK